MSEKLYEARHVLSEPSLDIQESLSVPVFSGAESARWHTISSTSNGTSEASFNFQVPRGVVIDRKNSYISGNLCFAGVTRTANDALSALNAAYLNRFSPNNNLMLASFPGHQSMQALSCSVNSVSQTISPTQYLPELMRVEDPKDILETLSSVPAQPDQVVGFEAYADSAYTFSPTGRTSMPGVYQPNNAFAASAVSLGGATASGAVVQFASNEAIGTAKQLYLNYAMKEPIMHPLFSPMDDSQGLMAHTFGMKISWSAEPRPFRGSTAAQTGVTCDYTDTVPAGIRLAWVNNVKLHLRLVALNQLQAPITRQLIPYHSFESVEQPAFTAQASGSAEFTPVNGRVPQAVLLCFKPANRGGTIDVMDHSLRVTGVTAYIGSSTQILFDNADDGYQLVKKNLGNAAQYLDYNQAQKLYGVAGSYGSGSYVLLKFGEQITLPPGMVPGSDLNTNISFKVTYERPTAALAYNMIPHAIYAYETVLITNASDNSSTTESSMSAALVAEALQKPYSSDEDPLLEHMIGGKRSFWRKLKQAWRKVGKPVLKAIRKTGVVGEIPFVGNHLESGLKKIGAGASNSDMFY